MSHSPKWTQAALPKTLTQLCEVKGLLCIGQQNCRFVKQIPLEDLHLLSGQYLVTGQYVQESRVPS